MKKTHFLFTVCLIYLAQLSFAQRVVLIEQFTNSGCPPCAASTPPVLNYVDNNISDVVAISYHTSFPYSDSMYFENPAESNARVAYYTINSVPYSIVDGNYYSNTSSNFNPVIASTINNRKAIAKKYSIFNLATSLSGNMLTGKLVFESLDPANTGDSLRAHIVVIEKNVLKSAYAASPGANTETNYEYVMRKMLPDQNGSHLTDRHLNGKDTLTVNWPLQKIKNNSEIRIVAFVQNINTKEVYAASLFSPSVVSGIRANSNDTEDFLAYPNPASNDLTIQVKNLKTPGSLTLVTVLGNTIFSSPVSNNETFHLNTTEFSKGIYFAILSTATTKTVKKVIVQ